MDSKMIRTQVCLLILWCLSIQQNDAMVVHRSWTSQHWCESVEDPHWPFAYQKQASQTVEWQGRVNSNAQDMRHECTIYGSRSKCHICSPIERCGDDISTCNYQLQGIDWDDLPKNIPTVSDVPWAVNGMHRYDYGGESTSHICVFTSAGECLSPFGEDYNQCTLRCWGTNSGRIENQYHPNRGNSGTLENGDKDASDIWRYPPDYHDDGRSQGRVGTLAGSGKQGFRNGRLSSARFNFPQDVAIDSDGKIYVADTLNHRIRRIDTSSGTVDTFAGTGAIGHADGDASAATFSSPTGVAVYRHETDGVVVYVADTGNHRIRKIVNGVVSCFSGLCGDGVETYRLSLSPALPHAGLADGSPSQSRFDTPMGIAVDPEGNVFVADTGNYLIRYIFPDGTTNTLAGNVINGEQVPGCVAPCLEGVPGFRDGNLTYAQFLSPRDVAVGPDHTVIVADGHRIRRVSYDGIVSTIEGITSKNRVVTLAGSNRWGALDGSGDEATFHAPSGVTVSSDNEVYVASPLSCSIRRLSTAQKSAQSLQCDTKVVEIILPSGCNSYEPAVDELFLKETPVASNIYYNYQDRWKQDPIEGLLLPGRIIRNCVGSPPADALQVGDKSIPIRDANGDIVFSWKQDDQDGTILKVQCPGDCSMTEGTNVFGTNIYTDESSVCLAAKHSGVLQDAQVGLLEVRLERGIHYYNASFQTGSTANGIESKTMPSASASARLFSIHSYPQAQTEVQMIAGKPSALLTTGCGYEDAGPPQVARFNRPSGIEVMHGTSLSRSQHLIIADSHNHRIRYMTAVCSKPCENGGTCTSAETCTCSEGWTGHDCTIPICHSVACGSRQVCVGPDTCACVPGYTGVSCETPTCVQTCEHGGECTAPDTCSCPYGWFDSNCTTPVCSQTCGNGGNCTAPDTCRCTQEWQGNDCRIPVCTQECMNGASCVAPNTCQCAAGWSGFDCSLPICAQGTFVPHPSGYVGAMHRPFSYKSLVPCDFDKWCEETNEFDCLHRLQHDSPVIEYEEAELNGSINGRSNCFLIEVGATALTHFQYSTVQNESTGFYRFSPQAPYEPDASPATWTAILSKEIGRLPPFTGTSDRQIAFVEKRSVIQGVYACAHGGSCIAPDVCECAEGWIGFDCRTPVCSQGYYVPTQDTFVASDPPEAMHERHPVSNPAYIATVESIGYASVTIEEEERGQVQYEPNQGGYTCSIRSVTQWEKPDTTDSPAFYFDHPNYYSLYMDRHQSADGHYHTHWMDMYWPPLYRLSTPTLDNTREGWRRAGIWQYIDGRQWQKGKCLLEFQRSCQGASIHPTDLVTMNASFGKLVVDTDASYRPQVEYNISFATRYGFWNSTLYGSCIDQVHRGCFNNGTCVAPGICACASGWSGYDCSIPLCDQTCFNGGNCTLPNRCTCEKGWTGDDCSIPLCAQECRNGGKCVAPDVCECRQWDSIWQDGRGFAIFQQPDGAPQLTGYTGYDCNTPICVMAEAFVLTTDKGRTSGDFISLRGHVKNSNRICNGYRCPQFDMEVVANDGKSFQSGCSIGNPLPNPKSSQSDQEKIINLLEYRDDQNVNRTSDTHLCGNTRWEQGDYIKGRHIRSNHVVINKIADQWWEYGQTIVGEGVYKCYNKGSCIAPDTCACGDGWTGIDCQVPKCRFRQDDGSVLVGCKHDGVCVDKDTCECITVESQLRRHYPDAPVGTTGYFGEDCDLPICVQGIFDPLCNSTSSRGAGVDGCYRCKNGGACVAPDVCECAQGWRGYDCSEPVCEFDFISDNTTQQLFTVDDSKVEAFKRDPCGTNGGRWGKEEVNGALIGQGNCTLPSLCTCLCKEKYDPAACDETGEHCEKPWQDPFDRSLPDGYVYGTRDCVDGYQGIEDEQGRFQSCHLRIYVPSMWRRYTASFVALLTILGAVLLIAWVRIRKQIRRRLLLAKMQRRRAEEDSDEEVFNAKGSAFVHPKDE